MATASDYAAWIVQNQDKQGTPEFDTVARAYSVAKAQEAPPPKPSDPTQNIGATLQFGPFDTHIPIPDVVDNTLAGFGKAFVDTGRRVKQLVTLNGNQADIDRAAELDAPLMHTKAGIAGNILGNIAMMALPAGVLGVAGRAAAEVPAIAKAAPALLSAARGIVLPQSIPAAAAVGAGTATLTQPISSFDSYLKTLGAGALAGAAPGMLGAGAGLARDLVAPFMKSGQERIAGKAIQRFATDPRAVANAPNAPQLVPGSMPNLAEATLDPGVAQYVRALRNNPDANAPLTQLDQANRAARLSALQDIAGNPADRAAWVQARQDVTGPLYEQAFAQTPKMTPWAQGQITQLMKRPAFQKAWADAAELASNEGVKLHPDNAVQITHYAKMALDDQIEAATRAGNTAQARAVIGTRDKLVSLMESKDFSPQYAEARSTYKDMSRPINQIDVGQTLVNKFQPALADFGADTRTTAATFANALRNADQTAQQATGFSGAKMADILGPEQMGTVTNIAKDLGRSAKAQELGMARGSPTMQNFAANDILRGVTGPFGLPQGWVESALPQQLLRAGQLAYSVPDKRVLSLLGEAAADPKLAAQLLAKVPAKDRPAWQAVLPYASSPAIAGLLGLSQ